jgi:hypothetical protein
MTIEAAYERPTWRQVNIDRLAQRLYAAHTKSLWGYEFDLHAESNESAAGWLAAAEAAVEMIVDEPEKEFQQSLAAVLNKPATESQAAREWREASAGDWMPEASCPTRLMDGRNELRCWLTAGHEGDCK